MTPEAPTTPSRARTIVILAVLGTLTAFAPFTIDTYLPAFPALVAEFDVGDIAVQLTLAATMIGFAAGQLAVGPWSDRIGRKVPLLIGCSLHLLASLAVVGSQDLAQFMVARVFQGFGAAASTVVAIAIARDLFSGYSMVRALSFVALVGGLAPLIAPVVGSRLLLVADWRGVFLFLACYALLMLFVSQLALPESLPRSVRASQASVTTARRYGLLLRDPSFIGLMLLGGLRFTGLFAYLQASPFLFQRVYGLDPQEYGLVFAFVTLGMLVGVQSSSRLAMRLAPRRIIALSLLLITIGGALIMLSDPLGWKVGWVIGACIIFMLGCGLGLPMIQTLALLDHPAEAGTAAALVGAASFGAAGLLAPALGLTSVLGLTDGLALGAILLATSVIAAVVLVRLVRPSVTPLR